MKQLLTVMCAVAAMTVSAQFNCERKLVPVIGAYTGFSADQELNIGIEAGVWRENPRWYMTAVFNSYVSQKDMSQQWTTMEVGLRGYIAIFRGYNNDLHIFGGGKYMSQGADKATISEDKDSPLNGYNHTVPVAGARFYQFIMEKEGFGSLRFMAEYERICREDRLQRDRLNVGLFFTF